LLAARQPCQPGLERVLAEKRLTGMLVTVSPYANVRLNHNRS